MQTHRYGLAARRISQFLFSSSSLSSRLNHQDQYVRHRLFFSNTSPSSSTSSDNHFEILGLPQNFHVDPTELSLKFKQLQRQWHPDRHVNTSEQHIAADMSAKLNVAYQVLRQPHRRASHLLNLMHIDTKQQQNNDSQFIAWVMHFREDLDDTIDQLKHSSSDNDNNIEQQFQQLKNQFEQRKNQCLDDVAHAFQQQRLHDAALYTSRLHYFASIQAVFDQLDAVPTDHTAT